MQERQKRIIRKKADEFRVKCKISKYGLMDLFKECERLGFKPLRYPLGENADLGFTIRKDKDIVVFTNSSIRLSREIFTLAHEIGHAILHLDREDSFVDNNITINNKYDDEKEQEANYFAACLLLPGDNLRRFIDLEISNLDKEGLSAMDIARIMSEFNVSFDMVLNRLENLEIIDIKHKLLLDNEKTEKKVGNLLRSVGGNSKLNYPSYEINIPYEYIDYVIYNYNHKAIPKETLERALACYRLTIDDISDKLINMEDEDEEDIDDLIRGLDI